MGDSYLDDQSNNAVWDEILCSFEDFQQDYFENPVGNSINNDGQQLKQIDDYQISKQEQHKNLMEQLEQDQSTKNQTNIISQPSAMPIEKNQNKSSPGRKKKKNCEVSALNQGQKKIKPRKQILKSTEKNGIKFFMDLVNRFEQNLSQQFRLSKQEKQYLQGLVKKSSSWKIDQLFKRKGQIKTLLSRLFSNKNLQRQIFISRYRGKDQGSSYSRICKKKILVSYFKKCFYLEKFYSITSYKNSA